jgi:hypothetical protein
MTGIRRGWFGALAALLLAGCASYPATYYDAGDGYGYGDYSFGERRGDFYDDRYFDGGAFWSPAWSVYYANVLYPPYWRSYDPWYTPGWHYGQGYAPGAGWRLGWSSYRYDPWWGGGWYSPFRYSGFGYRPNYYGFGYGYGHGYGWGGGYSSNRSWRELERRYGRRAYDPDRRSGGDRRASDELDRIARRNGISQYDDAPRPGDSGFRGGAGERVGTPSAYDGRRDVSGSRNGPSRFGNPVGAAPPAGNDDGSDNGGLGRRANGWVAPAPSDGGYSRRGGLPQDGQRAPREWSNDGAPERPAYRRIDTPRAWGESEPARRDDGQDGGVYGPDRGRVSQSIDDAARYQRPESPRYERREAPRYEQRESPRFQRQEMPRYERQESPAYERQSAPREQYSAPSPRFEQPARFEAPSRDDSPRFEAPSRDDGDSRSASRELERIARDDEQP